MSSLSDRIEFVIENGVLELMIGNADEVVIPDNVTAIGDRVFEGRWNIKRIVIPNSVTSIGDTAFGGCYNLESIVIPDSVTKMGKGVFSDCYGMVSVTLSRNIKEISESAFYNCRALEAIDLPEGIISIGDQAFFLCLSLDDIKIPATVETVGNGAFKGCRRLRDEKGFVVLNGILYDYVGMAAQVDIPLGITQISAEAFADYPVSARIHMPKNAQGITVGSSESISILRRQNFISWVSYTDDFKPEGKTRITSVRIPDGVVRIGKRAFYNCSELLKTELPPSIEEMGEDAFTGCNKLYDIRFPRGIPRLASPRKKNDTIINSDFYIKLYLYGDESENEALDVGCKRIIRKSIMKWFKNALKMNSEKGVKRAIESCKRVKIWLLDEFIDMAVQEKAPSIAAYLLSYKGSRYTPEELERYYEEKINNELGKRRLL